MTDISRRYLRFQNYDRSFGTGPNSVFSEPDERSNRYFSVDTWDLLTLNVRVTPGRFRRPPLLAPWIAGNRLERHPHAYEAIYTQNYEI